MEIEPSLDGCHAIGIVTRHIAILRHFSLFVARRKLIANGLRTAHPLRGLIGCPLLAIRITEAHPVKTGQKVIVKKSQPAAIENVVTIFSFIIAGIY